MNRSSALLIDTNILLLLIIGRIDRDLIARFKRTADRFDGTDFDLLTTFIADHTALVTTPHVLTEANSLLAQLKGTHRSQAMTSLRQFVERVSEHWRQASELMMTDAFAHLGLTDAAILLHAETQGWRVLTDDYMLAARLMAARVPVINFNHFRDVG